jgi:hypothetical protein
MDARHSDWWWHMPVIPALGRLRQENCEFKVSLSYIESETLSQKAKNRITM